MAGRAATRRRGLGAGVIVGVLAAVAVVGVVLAGATGHLPGVRSALGAHRPDSRPSTRPCRCSGRVSSTSSANSTSTIRRVRPNSQGVTEPWCADFVSWTMREAGVPLRNPNSGSWRIPGVANLTDHLRDVGRLRPATYRPTPGDIVLYDKPSPMGQHTNVVVAVAGDEITTVGGNERDGVTLRTYRQGSDPGIIGYGVLVD
ncbi:CHAP domain containing protein [Gordonia bronchialis DSM 43247]|uniref:CHAP domain containing protein n=1 Tax=Gordonia bronchialis (strain ATCC 25592 / DSM 43247 / BCRC 13721 / JCM 3198 / KCTC 3076 / NBRC 16047 / NCTC 10667) TaxID=526226 RepID=D0LAY6_GORB4|nr:CHAP domain-containing protein [Gordonia bronchialis]ACY22279.1 CHAP domain containing protein [Gordonia bronchialis DSM 43247]MCC3325070.1 CHAP domain-containing protein [Gordonia bronchialis]STQ65203.1 Uncharacterized protein conserved in bacteria [Gordonia bronchialis]